MIDNVIIMAGGAGKRLWPASVASCPKQFMRIGGEKTLFRQALDRAEALNLSGHIYVVTHENHVPAALNEVKQLSLDLQQQITILAEPVGKNTAPALALASERMILDGREKETVLVMAADHLISPVESFVIDVEQAATTAKNQGIVTFGIVPNSPATGYGYIEVEDGVSGPCPVKAFREKPNGQIAQEYVESGQHFWNSGMFCFQVEHFLAELDLHAPQVARVFAQPQQNWFLEEPGVCFPSSLLRELYHQCPAISIDYAVMEHTQSAWMVPATFQWSDVGSWDAIADMGCSTTNHEIQAQNNFSYSELPVTFCGVDDLIAVVANSQVFICKRGESQLAKDAAEAHQGS
ncbi:MAG: mannose-1-phosphate guanylyltransferase [Spirochaetales bacterium]|nr:mannose-1-phosphate guanylyltransferase [Spirochaetales bacterium]